MSKNTRFAVFFVIIMAVVLVLLSPSKETVKKDEEIVSSVVEETRTTSTRNIIKEAFMEGCLESGEVGYSYCSCSYDFLLKEHGLSGILEMEKNLNKTGELPEELWEAVLACSELLE